MSVGPPWRLSVDTSLLRFVLIAASCYISQPVLALDSGEAGRSELLRLTGIGLNLVRRRSLRLPSYAFIRFCFVVCRSS